ncbi:MAG: M48 family metallopeptidase [Cyclobacteriaceae bacterium]|nr:M48 family metallopeptidase [Cyclobacteriaceae bacterium]
MTPETILLILIILSIANYGFDIVLEALNLKEGKKALPKEAQGIYETEKYDKSMEYQAVQTKFGFVSGGLSFIISILFLAFGGFGWLNSVLEPHIIDDAFRALAFFGILFIASDLMGIPFQLYSTFVIEEKFGFNKTTPKLFILDKLKGYGLGAILGGVLLYVLLFLLTSLGVQFWWVFWLVITLFMLFMNMFYTTLFMPLFNKLSPLEDGELRTAIEVYSKKVNFPLTNIFVIDGSKRSSKANAFFSGFGKKKKVVLYDTLIENHSIKELVAIFAHEVGHYKKKHIIGSLVSSILQTGAMLYIMSLFIFNENLSVALGANNLQLHLNLIAFTMLYTPISFITGILSNVVSRKNEFEADYFAIESTNPTDLPLALKKLSVDNLSNLQPHPTYVFFHYSHPPLLKRLEAMKR